MLTPIFWAMVGIMKDGDWLNFYPKGSGYQYMLGNGMFSALQVIFGGILIRDTLPEHHLPVFALGSIITDIIARLSLHQSILSATSLCLLVAGICCTASLLRRFIPTKRVSPAPKVVIFGIGAAFVLHIVIFGIYFLALDRQPIVTLIDRAAFKFHDYVA